MLAAGLLGCGGGSDPEPSVDGGGEGDDPAPDAGPGRQGEEGEEEEEEGKDSDQPLVGLTPAGRELFRRGDKLFDDPYPEAAGLGPLYIRPACGACHDEGAAGPGHVQKFQILDLATRRPVAGAPEMMFGGTERPFTVAGAQPLLAPVAAQPGQQIIQSRRLGPSVLGRGYIEAVLDSEIERVAAEQAGRTDGIHGRINRVTYHSQPMLGVVIPHAFQQSGIIGRFGLKARVATLDDFAADAFQGDMGMTSPMRPDELANPDGLHDDRKPGVDVSAETLTTVAAYVRMLEIPSRTGAVSSTAGAAAFAAADCAVCHVPGLRTRPDFPVAQLADIHAPIYSDLLLHDMGEELADHQTDEGAGPRDWRTAPLIGLRFQTAFLHDGRAATVEVAILKHAGAGSEANGSVAKFRALPPAARAALLTFVQGL